MRQDFGLAPRTTFAAITSDPVLQEKLASVYATPDDLDAWLGGLAEDHVNGGLCGELFFTILKDQFTRVRDGDRFWYQSYLPRTLVRQLEHLTLANIIRRNTPIRSEIQNNVFYVPDHS